MQAQKHPQKQGENREDQTPVQYLTRYASKRRASRRLPDQNGGDAKQNNAKRENAP